MIPLLLASLIVAAPLIATAPARAGDPDVTGWWHVANAVTTTSYGAYRDLRLVYRLRLEQEGAWVFGRGEKLMENGRLLPPRLRTPIALAGTTQWGRVTVRFVEAGIRRKTEGSFAWTLADDGARMAGTFASTAANSSGTSEARRAPAP
jgi:hypothetical protein